MAQQVMMPSHIVSGLEIRFLSLHVLHMSALVSSRFSGFLSSLNNMLVGGLDSSRVQGVFLHCAHCSQDRPWIDHDHDQDTGYGTLMNVINTQTKFVLFKGSLKS